MSTRRRLINDNDQEVTSHTLDTTESQPTSTKTRFKEKFQSLGILTMILLIVFIGFQMTSTDVYTEIHQNQDITLNTDNSTPSPVHPSGIEVVVHEDDGDVEVDVPQKIPPDLLNLTSPNTPNQRQKMQNLVPKKHNSKKKKKPAGPLINIRAKYHDSKEENIILPSIQEMSKNNSRRFYSAISQPATLYGYNQQCMHSKSTNKCPHLKYALISGLYNTGTNVVYRLIAPNCVTLIKFQPGWGKHEMFNDEKIKHFNEHDYPNSPIGLYDESILIVVIKDPLTWLKSMCKANYDFRYFNRSWFFNSCPQHMEGHAQFDWLPMNRGKVMNRGQNKSSNGIYESPIHLWNDWYSSVTQHVNGTRWPYLIVRFEDLLFRVKSVVPQFCKCLGKCKYKKGVNDKSIKVADSPSKPHGNPRNRTMSFWAYSNPEYRYEGYSTQDLQYMLDTINQTLLKTFGYEFNVEKTLRMRL